MNTRLTVNLRDGIVEVEGSEDFVRSVYQDFKEQMAQTALEIAAPKPLKQLEQQSPSLASQVEGKRRAKPRRNNSSEGGKPKASDYKPTFKNLNLAGLADFYDEFSPTSHNEKILCFAVFLRDKLKIAPCSADDVYTCYFTLKTRTKTPEAFQQAFITAKNRTHYIEFDWPDGIEVTIAGDNFFNEKLNAAEAK